MKIDLIRAAKHAQPFVPFELVMKDGRTVRVADSIAIALSPTGQTVAGYDAVGRWFYLWLTDMSKLKRLAVGKRARRRSNGNET